MIIYKVTNNINNKVYIGQTIKTLCRRKQIHVYEANRGSSFHFHRALRFHGIENFTWEILEECNSLYELNLVRGHISSCLLCKRRSHKGYTFKYVEVPNGKI